MVAYAILYTNHLERVGCHLYLGKCLSPVVRKPDQVKTQTGLLSYRCKLGS